MSPIRSAPRRGGTAGQLRRWAPRALMLAGLLTVTTGCKSTSFTRLGMPPPVTQQGKLIVDLWQGSWIAAWAVGALVWGLIICAVIFYRKRSDRVPHQVRYNLPIEILYTVVPFIMIGVMFYFTAKDENNINKLSPHADVVVNVIGEQWKWVFQYPQYPVKSSVPGGQTEVTELGVMANPDVPINQQRLPLLEIPEHETVRFNLTSIDVIHAFWIVPFEFKRDVIPGHPNNFEVTPTALLSGGPNSIGRCTELCGVYHSRMLFRIKIVTPAQFRQWIHAQQAQQNASGGAQ